MRSEPPIVDDTLWALIEPLLPRRRPHESRPGRMPISDRQALNGILFVLTTGRGWNQLPTRLGFGSGVTCWRRLCNWQEAQVWDSVCRVLRAKLHEAERIDFSRAVQDRAVYAA